MSGERQPIFLQRRRYRLRRLGDAAYLLPVIGFILCALPAFRNPELSEPRGTASGFVYMFLVWAGLILGALVLSYALGRTEAKLDAEAEDRAKRSEP